MQELQEVIQRLTSAIQPEESDAAFDLANTLLRLSAVDASEDLDALGFICQRLEISQVLYPAYTNDGKRVGSEPAGAALHELAIAVLCKAIASRDQHALIQFKRFNALFKAHGSIFGGMACRGRTYLRRDDGVLANFVRY